MTFTRRGCCTSAQTLLSLLTHTLTLCLPLFNEYLLCWWSKAAALRAVLVCAYRALFWGENSLQRTQIHHCNRAPNNDVTLSGPATWVSDVGRRVHQLRSSFIHRQCWTSMFLIDNWHKISRNWSSFTAALLSCIDANGGPMVVRMLLISWPLPDVRSLF